MKHIKQYEGISDFTDKKFWILPTDERFAGAMNKIGADNTIYKFAIDSIRKMKHNYLIIYYNDFFNTKWNYIGSNINTIKFLEDEGYKNMGYIDIPQYELDMVKYNL